MSLEGRCVRSLHHIITAQPDQVGQRPVFTFLLSFVFIFSVFCTSRWAECKKISLSDFLGKMSNSAHNRLFFWKMLFNALLLIGQEGIVVFKNN